MENKKASYLPNGSVVLIEGNKNRIIICGRMVRKHGIKEMFDYMGYRYPHGYQNQGDEIFFMHSQIEMVFFLGFQDMEELVYREVLLTMSETIDREEEENNYE